MMRIFKTVITIVLMGLLLFIGYLAVLQEPPNWTGFGEVPKNPDKEPAKTLFDWLELLVIPLTLGLLAWS